MAKPIIYTKPALITKLKAISKMGFQMHEKAITAELGIRLKIYLA